MSMAETPSSFEMSDYLGVLRRRWWIILIFVILGTAAGGAYMKVTPKSYSSTVSLYVTATAATANQVAGGRTNGAVNMDSEAQVAQSLSVQRIAETLLGTTSPGSISTAVPPNSQVLQITCTAASATGAERCANAYGQAYLKDRNETSTSTIQSQLTTLVREATAMQASSAKLARELAALPHTNANASRRSTLQAQEKAQHSQLTSLNKKVAALNLQKASTSVGYVISKAQVPSSPSSPKLTLVVPSGLMAGLLLGVLAAVIADRPGRRFYTARDVERRLQLPVLLSLPRKDPGWQGSLVSPRSRSGQAFTDLAHMTASTLGEGSHVIFVVGGGEEAASGKVAVNLAAALARTRADVVLASASPRSTSVAQPPGQGGARGGLLELLAGTVRLSDVALQPVEAPGLRVIPRGQDSLLSFDQFQHRSLKRLISELRGEGRYVIIDAPAAGDGSDGFVLAEFADAAIVVIELAATSKTDTEECVSRLDRWGSTILGAAVVPPAGKSGASKPAAPRPVPAQPAQARPVKRRGKGAEEAAPGRLDRTLTLPQVTPDSDLLDRYSISHDSTERDNASRDSGERDRRPDILRGN